MLEHRQQTYVSIVGWSKWKTRAGMMRPNLTVTPVLGASGIGPVATTAWVKDLN